MQSFVRRRFVLLLLLALALATAGCRARPWRAIVRASHSELSAAAQTRDRALDSELRRALFARVPSKTFAVRPHVYMERGFVVGDVLSAHERDAVEAAARTVVGLRSIDFYLPIADKNTDPGEEDAAHEGATGGPAASEPGGSADERASLTSQLEASAEIQARLLADRDIVASRVEVDFVGSTIVLLGVVREPEQARVLAQVAAAA